MTSIDLTKLDFDDIKTSITDYMESQPNTVDFDWNNTGSVANTVLDLLAYNTMYYAFYSSMLINESYLDTAQRLDSIISLAKPFYFVTKSCRKRNKKIKKRRKIQSF